MTNPHHPTSPYGSQGGQGWQQPGQPYMSPDQARQAWAQQGQQQYPGQQYPAGPPGGPPPPWTGQPGYGGQQQPPPKKKMGLGAKIGIGVLCFFGFGACLNAVGDDTPRSASNTVPSVSQTQQAAPAAPAQPETPAFAGAQPGDIAAGPGAVQNAGGLTLSATELTEGSSTFGPTLCTQVSYRAGSDGSTSYNLFDWSLQNPRGNIVNPTFFGGQDTALGNGELTAGGTVEGAVCFEDENASPGDYVLLYDPPSFLNSERTAWINPR